MSESDRTVVAFVEAEYRRYRLLGTRAMRQVSDADLAEADAGGNSIATLVWHVAGNLESRFTDFLITDGEKPGRDRDSEFLARRPSRAELDARWASGWDTLMRTLAGLTDADLLRTITIRGVPLRVDEALLRSLAHAAYHVGQIVLRAKAHVGDAWETLSVPPGGSAAYNLQPTRERAADHSAALDPEDRHRTEDVPERSSE